MTNLSFNSSLRTSALSAWPFSPRDFSRISGRIYESGLAPSQSRGREKKTLTLSAFPSKHAEISII